MRALLGLIVLVLIIGGLLIAFGLWRPAFISGSLPTVAVEGGKAPEFKPNLPKVDLTITNKTIAVPSLQVTQPAAAPAPGNSQ